MTYKPEELISSFLLGSMTREQANAFSAWILEHPDNGRAFVRSALLHRGIHEYFCSMDMTSKHLIEDDLSDSSYDNKSPFEDEFWAQLSREERDAPALQIQKDESPEPKSLRLQKAESAPRSYPKGYLWFSMVSIAATFLLFLYVWAHPRHIPQDVATVIDIYRTQWSNTDIELQKGTRLFDNRKPLNLTKGVMKVQFDNGVQVVVEGPAIFSLEADERMRLAYGKLYVKVPKQAIGFRVNTPSCGVIDLGTEFGMDVNDRGDTSVHLFKGKASLVTSIHQLPQQSQILYQQQAKSVSSSGNIRSITFQSREFVRDFDSDHNVLWNGESLNLASVVSGGNGFGKVYLNMGIDQKTGQPVSGNIEERANSEVKGYVPVTQMPFVDGVFVPDGENGPVQLTSAGQTFDGFGDTDGAYFMAIGSYSAVNMYTAGAGFQYATIQLKGYSEETSDNLCLHANSGITFDLQKIREAMPFINMTQFSSVYGVPKARDDQDGVASDFYVFVDGIPRMIKKGVSNQDEPGHVTIPLAKTDRFLTLVCTQGDQNFGDWSLFVNPTLELELAD